MIDILGFFIAEGELQKLLTFENLFLTGLAIFWLIIQLGQKMI